MSVARASDRRIGLAATLVDPRSDSQRSCRHIAAHGLTRSGVTAPDGRRHAARLSTNWGRDKRRSL